MTRAQLIGWARRLIELRVLSDLAAPGRPARQARYRAERTARLMAFLTDLPTERIERITERFAVGWLRTGRTPTIRRAKREAAERVSGDALRAMQARGRELA